jgi:GNAT superfamily N-acetyltransferase
VLHRVATWPHAPEHDKCCAILFKIQPLASAILRIGSTCETSPATQIRLCRSDEHPIILEIVNAAANAYRGVIPDDCWHEPYMPRSELETEVAAGVTFWRYKIENVLVGVMGIQPLREVDLVRHAYVRPPRQRRGVGAELLGHLRSLSSRRMLVGTWAAATWAIRFYRQHGFELVPFQQKTPLLKTYWSCPSVRSRPRWSSQIRRSK